MLTVHGMRLLRSDDYIWMDLFCLFVICKINSLLRKNWDGARVMNLKATQQSLGRSKTLGQRNRMRRKSYLWDLIIYKLFCEITFFNFQLYANITTAIFWLSFWDTHKILRLKFLYKLLFLAKDIFPFYVRVGLLCSSYLGI